MTKKILLVDNSIVIRDMLKSFFLNDLEVTIFEANSFSKVKELISNNSFFVVISNMVLTDSPNFELLELLKKENLPTIIFSSNAEEVTINIKYSNIIAHVIKNINGFKFIHRLVSTMIFCKNKEILVVDDSLTQSSYTKEILERIFIKAIVVKNGIEALDKLKESKKISLILSDYEMPGMNGLELTKRVRIDEFYSQVPIIVITVFNDNHLKKQLYANGVNDVLIKPILEEELISKIIDIFLNQKYIEEKDFFNELLNNNVITSTTDLSGKITSVSDAFCKISGYERSELIGKNHNIVRHKDTSPSVYKDIWDTIKVGETWLGEIKNLAKNGSDYWVKSKIEPKLSKDGEIIGYSSVRYDITDKKKLELISITDSLTNIYNRRYFNDVFPKILNNAKRKNELLCFLFMDIDFFKQYNDNYGHQKGDEVLINFAKCLKNSIHRITDFVFRLGGEEFAIIYQVEDKSKALVFANKVKQNIEDLKIEHKYSSASQYITASMGLICKNAKDINYDEIYKEADDLLYESKRNGRNQVTTNEL